MEYKIEGKHLGRDEHGKRRIAIVVTKWLDLSMFHSYIDHRGWPREYPIGSIPGAIRASFEDEPGIRLEQFTTENEAKLLSFLASHADKVADNDQGSQIEQENH
jgi:hypothetical protein